MPSPRRASAQARAPVAASSANGVARFGFLLFLGSESMLFAGLLAALAVFRLSADHWPPVGLPRLPVAITALNTLVLFASCVPMARALAAVRRDDVGGLLRGVGAAAALGATFLLVQGSEWVRLVWVGLKASSGPYGATFFTLVGCHALHVVGAVVWLAVLAVGARRRRFTARRHLAVELGAIYWYYVSVIWAVIFPSLYLGLR